MDERLVLLSDWVKSQWSDDSGSIALLPVSGDASFRRYFRFNYEGCSYIAVDAPPDKENNRAFISLSNFLLHNGVRSPNVLAKDLAQGFLLLEDFGDQLLLPKLLASQRSASSSAAAETDRYYQQALETLLSMQQIDCGGSESLVGEAVSRAGLSDFSMRLYAIPPYSQAALREELSLFPEWFLQADLGMTLSADERDLLEDLFGLLEEDALAQPQVFVHRDYHSRNIMLLEDGTLGIIDFQDAVRGPITYDLVSLLRDCYIRWPVSQTEAWVAGYWLVLRERALLPASLEFKQFLKWFDWMGVQRHLKVMGIFSRLSIRDGKHAYLQDLPRVLSYLLDVVGRYDELHGLEVFLSERVLPLYLEKYPQAKTELACLQS